MSFEIPLGLDDALANLAAERANAPTPARLSLAEARGLAARHSAPLRAVEWAALGHELAPERYARNLGTVGYRGQRALLRAHVAVVGAGGLGGWIIEGLARMGVGHLTIIDSDRFEENNLNRQLDCTEETLGLPKAECAARRVRAVNSAVEVTAHVAWMESSNATELLADARVVVDALDSLPARYVLQNAAATLRIPMVHGAIAGFNGQVTTIMPGDAGLRVLYGERPAVQRGIETQVGNPAATPMLVAACQVHEVVKLITGLGEPIHGRLLVFDAAAGEVIELAMPLTLTTAPPEAARPTTIAP